MRKFLFYSEGNGVSDFYNSQEECEEAATLENNEYPDEYSIYSFDDEIHDPDEVSVDDCSYIGYVGGDLN